MKQKSKREEIEVGSKLKISKSTVFIDVQAAVAGI
jgi:hypothetical protein